MDTSGMKGAWDLLIAFTAIGMIATLVGLGFIVAMFIGWLF